MGDKTNFLNKPTVVAVGLFVPGSGFTRVFQSLFENLSGQYNIHWLGIGYKGEVCITVNYTLHPCNINGGDIYGAYGAASIARQVKAQSVLLLNDFYLLKNYAAVWLPLKDEGIRLLAYVPLDGEIVDESITRDCLFLDEMVLYNQWAMKETAAAMHKFLESGGSNFFLHPRLSFQYHGVDTVTFCKAANSDELLQLRKRFFNVPDAHEAIFILNANRYNERKDIESAITGFAAALPNFVKSAYLCLHTPNLPPHLKEKLIHTISRSGCADRILLNPLGEEYISNEILADLYRACAIGINTSFGEGWGLISFEHAACGAAQIVPGHTAPAEIWKGAAVIIEREQPVKLHTNPFRMYAVNNEILKQELIKLINEPPYLHTVSQNCWQHAKKEMFSWGCIAKKWLEIL